MVEVDASDVGVGAVLSQHSTVEIEQVQRLHPCDFFSRHLSPAEWNYDADNRELLTVELAIEEQTTKTYPSGAKPLNSSQARWALLFGCFNFILTYCPGSKNLKHDALSRLLPWRQPNATTLALPRDLLTNSTCP